MCRFTEETIQEVWEKGTEVEGYDSSKFRQDACGAWMSRDKYGDRESSLGWEIDHIYPETRLLEENVEREQIDNIVNLRPLNWQNNASKGNDYPAYTAKCTSEGDSNVENSLQLIVNSETREQIAEFYKGYNLQK